jgi:phosphoribosylformimino-5-aminoimidazole carboxamide ribotide isomerase
MFRVVFVMDIFNRSAVLAKGGIREKYRLVSNSSKICNSSDPLNIVDFLQPREVYIADLNRLQGKGSNDINTEIIREVTQKTNTMLDFGISSMGDVDKALSIAGTAIIGTETGTLSVIKNAASGNPERISVSIDIKHGQVLKKDPEISENLFEIIKVLNNFPLKDLIFLDLDRVGTASGFDPVCLQKLVKHSKHSVLLAGGVRDMEDLFTLEKLGIRGALIATAIHSGLVSPEVMRSGYESG